ncbi:MAG: hypothetical protein ACTSWG_05335, partial [Candidatus Helarchaeota archaeon]
DYIRISKIVSTFREKEIRISAEAKPKIVQILNKAVYEKINEIIDTLPKWSRGAKKGNIKRKTIRLEDLEKL